MYIIFNSNNDVTGYCDFAPNIEDLSSRNEFYVECDNVVNPFDVVLGKYGTVFEPAPNVKQVTVDDQKKALIKIRDSYLDKTDWMVTRHLEQTMLNVEQSLPVDIFNNLLRYRQQLRDLPSNPDFPNCSVPEILF